ncbi:Piso0_005501 [Millerozyma farinosa CBS 7064]|uniref:Piso0_005501 protein n=1 Tax=Pichia sorbitophila (strain ATCC MYA-4447 / BCRC 22081 / CBS 7064 / NBRC 10061 / NRRL Y-12695) TaxID=559304 RepID=G8XZ67_PICSO|nr:Piso0_005501 [Millerozyma farinosa CBS 7064]
MATEVTERRFAETYLQLIGLSSKADESKYHTPSTYDKLSSLGPSLPAIKAELPRQKSGQEDNVQKKIDMSIKSIKPPHKFSVNLSQVDGSQTVYHLKTTLINEATDLSTKDIKAGDLKLLLKGKVIQDTATLSSLTDESSVSLMCMVSQKPAPSASETNSTGEADPSDQIPVEVKSLSADTWSRIHKVLVEDLRSEPAANEALKKLKKSWD